MEKITMDLQMFTSPVSPTTTNTHISTNFSKLLEPGLRKIFFETYQEIPEQFICMRSLSIFISSSFFFTLMSLSVSDK